MGWADCGTFNGRRIGYGISATCDEPGCKKRIDRGLGCVCGTMHGGENGCGEYFCDAHLHFNPFIDGYRGRTCQRCVDESEREHKTTCDGCDWCEGSQCASPGGRLGVRRPPTGAL